MAEPAAGVVGMGILEDLADEEGVRKLIECPVCLEIPLPPIYLCAKGHIVCNSCQSRTYACPLCRERYCNTRSFVAEGIVEKCNLRCRYSENGCPVIMKGLCLVEHLPVCDFRPVKCRDCDDKAINYLEYETHLFKDHKIIGTHANEAYVAYRINLNLMHRNIIDTCFWPQYFIKAFEKIFLLRLNAHQFTLNAWICLLGAKAECDKYSATIEYEPANDNGIIHSWRGPVNHFREEPINVISQGRALTAAMDTIMEAGAISSERAEWIYRIVISEKPTTRESSPTNEDIRATTTAGGHTSGQSRGITTTTAVSCKDSEIGDDHGTEDEHTSPRIMSSVQSAERKVDSQHEAAVAVGVAIADKKDKCIPSICRGLLRRLPSADEDSSDWDECL